MNSFIPTDDFRKGKNRNIGNTRNVGYLRRQLHDKILNP
jgi:hypothetical protein